MEARLAAIEIERCNLRAAIADQELREGVEKGSFGPECLELRLARRALEKGLQHAIPPGPYDYDLDTRPVGQEYTVDLGDGYTGTLRRSAANWTWLAYIRLPAGHSCIGKEYSSLSYEHAFPFELTYGPSDVVWEPRPADTFGIDHGNRCDLAPYHHFAGTREDRYADKGAYTTYEGAVEKLRQLKARFQEIEVEVHEEVSED